MLLSEEEMGLFTVNSIQFYVFSAGRSLVLGMKGSDNGNWLLHSIETYSGSSRWSLAPFISCEIAFFSC